MGEVGQRSCRTSDGSATRIGLLCRQARHTGVQPMDTVRCQTLCMQRSSLVLEATWISNTSLLSSFSAAYRALWVSHSVGRVQHLTPMSSGVLG